MAQREAPIQRDIVDFLRKVMPRGCIVHHSANEGVRGGKRGMLDGKRKKAMGQTAGFPDLEVLTWRGSLFFEVKAPGQYPPPHQRDLHEQMRKMGYRVAVVRSVEDVRDALREWHFPTLEIDETREKSVG